MSTRNNEHLNRLAFSAEEYMRQRLMKQCLFICKIGIRFVLHVREERRMVLVECVVAVNSVRNLPFIRTLWFTLEQVLSDSVSKVEPVYSFAKWRSLKTEETPRLYETLHN